MNRQVLGALRPTVGNIVGLTIQFSGRCPINRFDFQPHALHRATISSGCG